MREGSLRLQKLFLNPGELAILEVPTAVTTVLGSCISVTLHCPRLQLGTICHAVLPRGQATEPGKYVDQSLRYMLDYFRQRQVAPRELVAKLFGGADMFTQLEARGRERTVGGQNVQVALEVLRLAGLQPRAMDSGGQEGRKIVFFSHSGDVYLKRVKRQQLSLFAHRTPSAHGDL